jgi:O-antigen ligase
MYRSRRMSRSPRSSLKEAAVVSRAQEAVAPAYLLACLLLGGSAQGAWQNALLQVAGILILAWGAAAPGPGRMTNQARLLLLIAIAAIAAVLLQLVPLPPSLWKHGARARIVGDYAILGQEAPWLPISLTPYESLSALLSLIPPLAVLVAIVRLHAYRASWLAAALLTGAAGGLLLGILQVGSTDPNSSWYLYADTNFGSAVGFFANANHMATLLLITLPFLAAGVASARNAGAQHYAALVSGAAALAILLLIGIMLNGSLAGYLLAVPVLATSALIMLPRANVGRRIAIAVAMLSLVIGMAALASTGIQSGGKIGRDATTAVQSRQVILQKTGKAIEEFFPFGSGLGSFVRVYPLYQSPDEVGSEYVVHAHNDYAEIVAELGVAGIVLILAFLVWWVATAADAWRAAGAVPLVRAASIASAAILVHSIVDFPLRTAAISASFAMCLGLLAARPRPTRTAAARANDLRPSRHLVFE